MARKLDRTKPFSFHGPGGGRDIYIQGDRFYNTTGHPLPMDKGKLIKLGYCLPTLHGEAVLNNRIQRFLDEREVSTYQKSQSTEIEREVERFKAELIAKRAEEAKQRALEEEEASRQGVQAPNVIESGQIPSMEDLSDVLASLDDLEAMAL